MQSLLIDLTLTLILILIGWQLVRFYHALGEAQAALGARGDLTEERQVDRE